MFIDAVGLAFVVFEVVNALSTFSSLPAKSLIINCTSYNVLESNEGGVMYSVCCNFFSF